MCHWLINSDARFTRLDLASQEPGHHHYHPQGPYLLGQEPEGSCVDGPVWRSGVGQLRDCYEVWIVLDQAVRLLPVALCSSVTQVGFLT